MPDFSLLEAANIMWREVRRRLFTPAEARRGLALLQAHVEPTPTTGMGLPHRAPEIGIATNHSTYDTMYVAFALAVGATGVVASDGAFVRAMRTHSDGAIAAMVQPLDAWAASRGIGR